MQTPSRILEDLGKVLDDLGKNFEDSWISLRIFDKYPTKILPGIRSEKQFYAQKTNASVNAYEMKNNCCLFEMLSNEIGMAFSFLEYLFSFTDVNVFALCKLGKWWCHRVCNLNGKILNTVNSSNLAPEIFITKETK